MILYETAHLMHGVHVVMITGQSFLHGSRWRHNT